MSVSHQIIIIGNNDKRIKLNRTKGALLWQYSNQNDKENLPEYQMKHCR